MPSLIRRWPFTDFSAVAPAPSPDADALHELRAAAMRRMYPKLHGWWTAQRGAGAPLQAYAYLAGARTVEELEQRIDEVRAQPLAH